MAGNVLHVCPVDGCTSRAFVTPPRELVCPSPRHKRAVMVLAGETKSAKPKQSRAQRQTVDKSDT